MRNFYVAAISIAVSLMVILAMIQAAPKTEHYRLYGGGYRVNMPEEMDASGCSPLLVEPTADMQDQIAASPECGAGPGPSGGKSCVARIAHNAQFWFNACVCKSKYARAFQQFEKCVDDIEQGPGQSRYADFDVCKRDVVQETRGLVHTCRPYMTDEYRPDQPIDALLK